jgi:hypothetical protein
MITKKLSRRKRKTLFASAIDLTPFVNKLLFIALAISVKIAMERDFML